MTTTNRVEINTAGVTFRQEAFNEVLENHNPLKDFIVTLKREPENEFDANAIMVIVDEKHIGYIPAKVAIALAPAMDFGQKINAEMIEIGIFEKTQKNGKQKVLPYCRISLIVE